MKAYVRYFIATMSVLSFHIYGQTTNDIAMTSTSRNAASKSETAPKDDLVIVGYYVEEVINMTFGKRITKYEVSKLDMVYTNDLGPNNTRTVTPIYRKTKAKKVNTALALQSKSIVDTSAIKIEPIKVEVIAPTEAPKYISIDIIDTYAKVLDKGYKSIMMLTKVADKAYFSGDLVMAAKYYEELFNMTSDLESIYYYRYAQALKAINQKDKADEMMRMFESENISNNGLKGTKLVKN
ncbi:hypothetical protein [Flavobacterium sp. MEB061]|uniref:hypothetical protein n=1 Tax=Flavobacterium sp. MEB061 TaxID=1587524 RepID=UPI0006965118|nr:hypothetical protein [Flavobacterium sp. MEB061]